MATPLIFPTRNDIFNFKLQSTLSGTIFTIEMRYNGRMDRWIMNINDAAGNQIYSGAPILILRDLTIQYDYLSVPKGTFFATDDTQKDQQPGQFGFGVDKTLWYIDPNQ